MPVKQLANAATTTGVKTTVSDFFNGNDSDKKTIQVTGATTSGAGSATVAIEVSNDSVGWIVLATTTLTLSTTPATDGFVLDAPWFAIRANVTAISGTGANVTATIAY